MSVLVEILGTNWGYNNFTQWARSRGVVRLEHYQNSWFLDPCKMTIFIKCWLQNYWFCKLQSYNPKKLKVLAMCDWAIKPGYLIGVTGFPNLIPLQWIVSYSFKMNLKKGVAIEPNGHPLLRPTWVTRTDGFGKVFRTWLLST